MFIFQNNGKGKSRQRILYRIEDINPEKKKESKKISNLMTEAGAKCPSYNNPFKLFQLPIRKEDFEHIFICCLNLKKHIKLTRNVFFFTNKRSFIR